MAKKTHRLTREQIDAQNTAKWLNDGDGLYLQVTVGKTGSVRKSWVGPGNVGLGRYPDVSMTMARNRVTEIKGRKVADPGFDAVAAKRAAREQKRAAREQARAAKAEAAHTLDYCADAYIKVKAPRWTGRKTEAIRRAWIATHVPAALRAKSIKLITKADIAEILIGVKPRTETAWDLLGLLKRVIGYAMDKGWRDEGINPAEWHDRLENNPALEWMLDDKSEKHPAMRWQDLPAFYPLLIAKDTMSARALRLQIFGALRPHNVIQVCVGEIAKRKPAKFDTQVWRIAAAKMKVKTRKGKALPHDVFLNAAALALVDDEMRYEPVHLNGMDSRVERAWRAKRMLTDEQCEEIRNTPYDISNSFLARRYGCTPTHIAGIRTGIRRNPKPETKTLRPTPQPGDWLFPGSRNPYTRKVRSISGALGPQQTDRVLKDIQATLNKPFLGEDGRKPTARGFRGSFRTWAKEQTHFDNDVIEATLAHGNPFEGRGKDMQADYFHGDFAIERAAIMVMWGEWVTTGTIRPQWNDYLKPHAKSKLPALKLVKSDKRRRAS